MGVATIDEGASAVGALLAAADDFAERARVQEACRDRSRPGTAVFHQHAHSATLWRMAEAQLRMQASGLGPTPGA
ncbi:MAG TPA: hypothetical protein VLK03_05730 [Nocardioides sp.]|nr:hypothetical protein [Nocardioides sp.]